MPREKVMEREQKTFDYSQIRREGTKPDNGRGNGSNGSNEIAILLSEPDQPASDVPIEVISLKTRHNEDDPSVCCIACGGPTRKTYIPREYWARHIIVKAEELPIYTCPACHVPTSKLDALVEFLSETINRVAPTKDKPTIRLLRQDLALARHHQRLAHRATNR